MGDPRAILIVITLAVLGACIGSFLNVVVYRLPRECMSLVKPRSRCPRCATAIAWFDNLPVLSWMVLGGKCRHCALGISFRYPAVELATAGLFLGLGLILVPWKGFTVPVECGERWLAWAVAAVITSALVALSLIDLDYRILPDEITKSGIVLGPVLAFLAPSMHHGKFIVGVDAGEWTEQMSAVSSGVLGAVIAGGTLWLIGWLGTKAFKKDAMGLGDVKMIAAMGGCLGLWALLSLAVAAVVGAVIGIAVRAVTKDTYIPFGPFLSVGMWTVMLWGEEILECYLGLFS
ncbi:MAG: prepilin peptidase [Planctomycetes bacterium]|nr:prepilin peptidase [Planctomycetota bacterium]